MASRCKNLVSVPYSVREGLWITLWTRLRVNAKNPGLSVGVSYLFDAWQLYAGLPARPPSGCTACSANPFPTDLSYSKRHLPTNNT
ncbi:hypothetical protein EC847_14710 [Scandinavium goeteborgense]|uniref:Uncharacterized protein n=1 Tax=Scandinavium goeteborgense TaxID=1851514 RepID=A0A4R6DMR0_SCAGO|nr:hypothetical protein EC847_14710 [Scandinavium goeteborgense]